MNGPPCPRCGKWLEVLSTDNEWKYACRSCDQRFNAKGEPMPPMENWPPGYGRVPNA